MRVDDVAGDICQGQARRADIAPHVIGCHLAREKRVHNADDVAGNVWR
jgi:hypothetical protein